tara:strand:- start:888 stop:1130 length:243 start_codon:yes stop_codon:yes gene_type:complete
MGRFRNLGQDWNSIHLWYVLRAPHMTYPISLLSMSAMIEEHPKISYANVLFSLPNAERAQDHGVDPARSYGQFSEHTKGR